MPNKLFNRIMLTVVFLTFPNFWSNASLAILRRTYLRDLNSTCTVLVSTVTQFFAACDAAYPDILAEISHNSAVYNESYIQKGVR